MRPFSADFSRALMRSVLILKTARFWHPIVLAICWHGADWRMKSICEVGNCEEEQTSDVQKRPDSQLFYFLEYFSLDLGQTCETFKVHLLCLILPFFCFSFLAVRLVMSHSAVIWPLYRLLRWRCDGSSKGLFSFHTENLSWGFLPRIRGWNNLKEAHHVDAVAEPVNHKDYKWFKLWSQRINKIKMRMSPAEGEQAATRGDCMDKTLLDDICCWHLADCLTDTSVGASRARMALTSAPARNDSAFSTDAAGWPVAEGFLRDVALCPRPSERPACCISLQWALWVNQTQPLTFCQSFFCPRSEGDTLGPNDGGDSGQKGQRAGILSPGAFTSPEKDTARA